MYQTISLSGFADEIDESFDRQLEVIADLGMHYIELRNADGKNIADHTLDEVKILKKKLDAAGIGVSALGSPIGKIKITEPFEPHVEQFRHVLEIAKILGTSFIRMFSFYMPEGETADPADYKEEVIRRLSVLTDLAEKAGVMLLHENEKGIYGDTAARCMDLVMALGCPSFHLTYDFANFVQVGEDTVAAYHTLRPYIAYVHIKDAKRDSGEVVPPGTGDGRLKEILGLLKESGYAGFVSLEPHLADFAGFSALEQENVSLSKAMTGEESFRLAHRMLCDMLNDL